MSNTPLITAGFHHVTMVARDARRTLAFYRDVLGLGLVKRTVNFDDPSAYHLYFGDATGSPGTILTFFEWPTSPRGGWGLGGVHHVAMGVATPEAQLQWKRRLTDLGIPVSGPYDRKWFRSIYFTDPDGQILEIATKGPGYDVDEPIDQLGQQLIVPGAGHLRGQRDEAATQATTWPEPVPIITPEMALDGMHHITGITHDVQLLGDFYEQALGLKLVKKSVNQDSPDTPHWFWGSYDGARVAPHSAITLFEWPAHARRAHGGVGQTHHIAFRAPNADAQKDWREHLQSIGVEVSPVMDRSYFESIYFQQPDGLLLEIATDGPGFSADEPVEALGTVLKLPTWLEPDREKIEAALQPL